jgi:Zn finger protein HypA/HybF involved in hydrogenase expression
MNKIYAANISRPVAKSQFHFAPYGADELRCKRCNKLLAKENSRGILAAAIKCPRCGSINEV